MEMISIRSRGPEYSIGFSRTTAIRHLRSSLLMAGVGFHPQRRNPPAQLSLGLLAPCRP